VTPDSESNPLNVGVADTFVSVGTRLALGYFDLAPGSSSHISVMEKPTSLRGVANAPVIFAGHRVDATVGKASAPMKEIVALQWTQGTLMAGNAPIVFVVDDDISVRESLELLLRHEGYQCELLESAQAFLERPRAVVPSCMILDVELPGLNGLDFQKRIAAERTDMPIIFVTGHGDVPKTVQAMKAGAIEFLTKPFDQGALLSALREALKRSEASLRDEAEVRSLQDKHASLSPRERQVMDLVVTGLLNKQIGGELGISEITVKAHRGRVMEKMGAHYLAELVTMNARLSANKRMDT